MNAILSGGHYQLCYCTIVLVGGQKANSFHPPPKCKIFLRMYDVGIAGADHIQCPMKIK